MKDTTHEVHITPTTSEYHSRSEYHSNKVGISLAKRSEADEHCSPLQPLDRRSNITFAKQTYHYGKVKRSTFRVRGDAVEIFPASNSEVAIRVEFFGDEIDKLYEVEALTGKKINELAHVCIFPASQYAVGTEKLQSALSMIETDLQGEF